MKKTYVIRWKSLVNGRAGKGTKLFPREEAEQLVQELNREYPQIHHEMMEVDEKAELSATRHETEATDEMELASVDR